MKILRWFVAAAGISALLLPSVAGAAEFVKPADSRGNLVLSTTETHRNLYAAGGTVTVNSTTQGDLVVAGGTLTVDGTVESDAMVAGGTVTLNNAIGGDVRSAGGTVTINSQVAGDVLAAGGTLVLSEKSRIGGDVSVAGGTVTIDAPIAGNLLVASGDVTINSKIGGTVSIRGGKSVTFGPKAEIAKTVTVRAENQPVVKDGAKVPTIDYTHTTASASGWSIARVVVLGGIIWILAYLLVALVFTWMAPKRTQNFITQVHNRFWINSAIGFGALVALPIIVVILFVVLVGYELALVLLAGYVFAVVVAWVLSMIWVGSWVYQLAFKRGQPLMVNWQVAVIGALIFTLIRFVPILGSLFCAMVFLACFGQLLVSAKRALVEKHEEEK